MCLVHVLSVSFLECLVSCMMASLRACLCVCVLAFMLACLLACLPACLLVCLFVCLLAHYSSRLITVKYHLFFISLQKLGEAVEERRPHLELLTQRGRRIARMSTSTNADHINTQVSVMGNLWTNVCSCLSSRTQNKIDTLHYIRKFDDTFEGLSSWLHRLEQIVTRDKQLFYACSPEEQTLKIQAYRKDIESHETQRSSLNDYTIQLIDKELGNELVRDVMEQRDELNERWEALCIQLGISYKKAEQTKYSLKLLEAQLMQLNKWMNNVEKQLKDFGAELSCDHNELCQQLVDLQVSYKRGGSPMSSLQNSCPGFVF